jgi:ribosomal protein RSM22 (predicted rRNA methylase)
MLTEDGDVDPRGQVGKHILRLGKIHYRHVDKIPDWFVERQSNVCQHRTVAQIRRCLKSWMIAPTREFLEEYRNKKLGWRQTLKERDEKNEESMMAYGPEETVAYAQFHMKARFIILRRIFEEIRTLLPSFLPSTVIDFGCGPGTAATSAFAVWSSDMKKYSGIDISNAMIDAAKVMTKGLGPDFTFYEKTAGLLKRLERTEDRYSLAVIAYTLTELTSDPARQVAVQLLFESLDVGGVLVIVDRGNPIGSHAVRTARKFLLEKYQSVENDTSLTTKKVRYDKPLSFVRPRRDTADSQVVAKIISPCTHDKPCPLGPGLWCSFSQKVVSSMIHKDSQEKFSYVVIQKQAPPANMGDSIGNVDPWASENKITMADDDSSAHPSTLEVLNRLMVTNKKDVKNVVEKLIDEVDWEEYKPPLRRTEWGRVLRSPLKRRGHVSIDMCEPSGTVVRTTLSKRPLHHIPSLFTAIKKTTWGGLHPTLPDSLQKSPLSDKPNAFQKQVIVYIFNRKS